MKVVVAVDADTYSAKKSKIPSLEQNDGDNGDEKRRASKMPCVSLPFYSKMLCVSLLVINSMQVFCLPCC